MSLRIDARKNLGDFLLDLKIESSSKRIGIIGSSGSGKSMMLRMLSGLSTPDEGVIMVNDTCLYDSARSINLPARDRKTGFLFQNYALFPNMTLEENIIFSLDKKSLQIPEKISSLIDMLGLDKLRNRYPSQLSGGQRQRAALARALAIDPDILMLDEPFSALDNHLRRQTIDRFVDYLEDYQGIILFVTHNMEEAYRLCDEVVVISKGRVDSIGKREEMFSNPPTRTAAKLAGYRNITPTANLQGGKSRLLNYGIDVERDAAFKPYAILPGRGLSLCSEQEPGTFKAFISDIKESPFSVVVSLEFENGLVPLEWDIKRSLWDGFEKKDLMETLHIGIDTSEIIYLD
ncbi:sulfate/molybdate ABC transporter ATP-binding protein [Alkalibacter saccharofermentans]|uniref:Molybdate transport system ATP-binding protein n=1 Tax=Alkalibacter saccharofermentans DSM 14828 TaxID=1120975 RepID=A0A1M4SAV7_9FIRM|nr:ATP-binding cassette domain-containing protein [Alkalibacter saccharofermentans]SHE29308.1 molybdate transport system ATP-binding protein [Alkalibacter saccharofermentans DSM 14828]